MPRFKIRRARLCNWAKIADATVEFPERGLVLVLGDNRVGAGKSIGAGKTSLGLGVVQALLGLEREDDARLTQKLSTGPSYVRVEGDLDGVPLVVETGYNNPKAFKRPSESLRYQYGDAEPVMRASVDATRTELSSILGVNSNLAGWTVFIDGDKVKFPRLSHTDGMQLVMDALHQPRWSSVHEKARESLTAAAKRLEISQSALRQRQQDRELTLKRIAEAREAIVAAEAAYDKAERDHLANKAKYDSAVAEARKKVEMTSLKLKEADAALRAAEKSAMEAVRDLAERLAADTEVLGRRKTKLSELQRAADRAESAVNQAKSNLGRLEREASKARSTCPTCNQPWTEAEQHRLKQAEDVLAARDAVKAAEVAYSAALEPLSQAELDVKDCEQSVKTSQKEISQAKSAATLKAHEEFDEAKEAEREARQNLQTAELFANKFAVKPSASAVEQAKTRLEERVNHLAEIEELIKKEASNVTDDEMVVSVAQYWVKAYGPGGILNMLLREVLPQLNATAAAVSRAVTGGVTEVTFNAEKTLQSGDTRPKLELQVKTLHGSDHAETSSKGEGGLINFIVSETLAQIGLTHRRVGWRWYDEVVNNQDPVVRSSVYRYLRDLAQREDILIFIVDHHADATEYADKTLYAVKDVNDRGDAVTTYRWAD